MKKVKLFEQYLNEVTKHMISGNSGRTVSTLDNSKYELKKEVKGARIGDYVNVVLPKGTIIYNLPGGVFAYHDSLKQKYVSKYDFSGPRWDNTYGIQLRSMPETLEAIEKNSKILESKGLELVHAYDKDGTMYGTGELVKKQGSKTLVRFDSETEKWFDNKDVKLVESKYNGNIAGDAAEYIAKELSQYVKGVIDQSNDAVTYFHLKNKSDKSKVIKALRDIYGLDAQDGGTQFSPSPTIKFDNDIILEAIINEAKDATREEIMDLMETKYKIRFVRTSEEFDGEKDGIWIAGDNGEELSGNKIFDYYSKSAKYKNGVLKNVVDAIEKKGWWFSWNDPGTMMIWPKN